MNARQIIVSVGLTALSFLMTACIVVIKERHGDGVHDTDTRALSNFLELEAVGVVDVLVVAGAVDEVVLEGDRNLVASLHTRVKNGRLTIAPLRDEHFFPTMPLKAIVTTTGSLESVSLVGKGTITVKDIDTSNLGVELVGEGKIALHGAAASLDVSIVGEGKVDACNLETRRTVIEIVGEGRGMVCALDELEINVVGKGHVAYYCDPATVKRSMVGSGTIIAR
jgi:hypothetical protein